MYVPLYGRSPQSLGLHKIIPSCCTFSRCKESTMLQVLISEPYTVSLQFTCRCGGYLCQCNSGGGLEVREASVLHRCASQAVGSTAAEQWPKATVRTKSVLLCAGLMFLTRLPCPG
jgi:hypothetical protein